jgi:hypothetical protein
MLNGGRKSLIERSQLTLSMDCRVKPGNDD